ncbi:UBP1-associated protein 2A [Sarracenia purpurea var. burkii]
MATKRKFEPKSIETQSKKQQHIEEEQGNGQVAMVEREEEEEEDEDKEPFRKLLEPFSKEQLINLLCLAADKHTDVAASICKVADEDPAHRKIFVHGLGWDTNAETLTNAFKHYGEIVDCKAVCDKISGKSKGYGFILFKTRNGARKALKQPQKKIGNRMTACQLASIGPVPPFPAAQASAATAVVVPASSPASEYTQRKIYVSNVSADLDPQKLLTFFSKYGHIEEGPLGLDKQTGKPKGFCLFVYKTIASAKKALEEPHKNFEGHILHCQKAVDGPKQSKSHSHHYPNAHASQPQRGDHTSFVGSAARPGHLMAPAAPAIPANQVAAAQAFNPALGQALSALLATQGASLGLNNFFGAAGVGASVNPVAYGNQGVGSSVTSGFMGSYANQVGYQNQQIGQGSLGGSQHGVGHIAGIVPYKGN